MQKLTKAQHIAVLDTFAAIDAAWAANYGVNGRIKNLALARRIAARERELSISLLGWSPEVAADGPLERYSATGSELRRWASELRPLAEKVTK